MEYIGKLYGKIGNKYFDTGITSEDYNRLQKENSELKKQALNLPDVSQSDGIERRELLKKWWEYFDKECIAINCNDEERDEVINDFFNGG
jgi:hypothetical protein